MAKAPIRCAFVYNDDSLCPCSVRFEVRAVDSRRATARRALCGVHLSVYLMKHRNVIHTVRRVVPRRE